MDRHAPWGLQIGEIALPDRFAFAGKAIGEVGIRQRFGCSIIGIERQSFAIANPGPASHLFPGDHLLVLGTDEQIQAAREYLLADRPSSPEDDTFRDLALDYIEIPENSPACGHTLAELNWPRLLGIQVLGHERAGQRSLTPAGDQRLEAGDGLLALGTPLQLESLRERIDARPPAESPNPAHPSEAAS